MSAFDRDARGRFLPMEERFRRMEAEWRAAQPPLPIGPTPEQIIANPTDRHPRWRLRVFDLAWPWRASKGQARRDALASGNARRYPEDREFYLDACADIQRDPPFYLDNLRLRMKRGEL